VLFYGVLLPAVPPVGSRIFRFCFHTLPCDVVIFLPQDGGKSNSYFTRSDESFKVALIIITTTTIILIIIKLIYVSA